MKKIAVIGSGFSGLVSATLLAQHDFDVHVLEKNNLPGGRAQWFEQDGFMFDMGPSWYWMPDVFEHYFKLVTGNSKPPYELIRLDPSYQIFYKNKPALKIPASTDELFQLFESIEQGSSIKLKKFLNEAEYKYQVGMQDMVYKPGKSILEYVDGRVLKSIFKLHLFTSISSQIRTLFKDERLIQLLEFPVLFLGAKPEKTPALYSLMNYADLVLGTWYPMGGMRKIAESMQDIAIKAGVQFSFNDEVKKIKKHDHKIHVESTKAENHYDYVVASADYHHIEQNVLEEKYRTYSKKYWDKRTLAPSAIIYYLGINKKVDNLLHHNLFFDEDFNQHAYEIYDQPQCPKHPLFYVCCPSKTDKHVAPEGCENLFILIPCATDVAINDAEAAILFDQVIQRIEEQTKTSISHHIIVKKKYTQENFKKDYYSFKGNAYGLANTLSQTGILKPKMKSNKLKNLYFTGQLTVPGPGVPPSIISGEIVANEIIKQERL